MGEVFVEPAEIKQGIPIYIDHREPEIDNPLNSSESTYWYPANSISIKLTSCLESMRDIHKLLELLNQDTHVADKRLHKLLVTPVFSLAHGVENLFKDIEGNANGYGQITAKQKRQVKKHFLQFSKEVPLQKGSNLKAMRDKLAAHIDNDIFLGNGREIWKLVEIGQLLEWIKATLNALITLLELDIFAWTQESDTPAVLRLMSVDGVRVDLNLEEKLILGVSIVRSPKYYISNLVQKIESLHSAIKAKRA
jgi:hypothetical protein